MFPSPGNPLHSSIRLNFKEFNYQLQACATAYNVVTDRTICSAITVNVNYSLLQATASRQASNKISCSLLLDSYIPMYIQQDATLHSLFISGNCSTCFGWYHHPSSGAHTTVSTASGICHNTVTAIWRYRGRVGTALQFQLFHLSSFSLTLFPN
jgi:hypothetical protein